MAISARTPKQLQARETKPRRLRLGLALALPFLLAFPLGSCKESPGFVKSGPRFAAVEKAPPGKALVYFFWPREEQGRWNWIWIEACDETGEQLRRGDYTTLAIQPGPGCFRAQAQWDLRFIDAVAGKFHVGGVALQDLASLELNVETDQSYFVRVEQKPFLLTSRVELKPAQRPAAEPEIRRCRRTVPLSPEEIVRQLERQDQ